MPIDKLQNKIDSMTDTNHAMMLKSTRLSRTFLNHILLFLHSWNHVLDWFTTVYKSCTTIHGEYYYLHALRTTQSPLEAYFSQLRGVDSNSAVTGADYIHRRTSTACRRVTKLNINPSQK